MRAAPAYGFFDPGIFIHVNMLARQSRE